LELGSGRYDALIATGTEALRKSAALVSEGLRKNDRFQKKSIFWTP
jgi:hypothetical protein